MEEGNEFRGKARSNLKIHQFTDVEFLLRHQPNLSGLLPPGRHSANVSCHSKASFGAECTIDNMRNAVEQIFERKLC